MSKTGKITKSEFRKEWGNDKGTFYSHSIEVEGVGVGEISCKEKQPSFLNVGETIEVEVKETEYGNKFKRVMQQKGGFGGKRAPQMMPYLETVRMCKSNAISAMVQVNQAYEKEVITSKDLAVILAFSLGEIKGEIPKWQDEHNNLISRLASVSNAAQDVKVYNPKSVQDIVDRAGKFFKYVIG